MISWLNHLRYPSGFWPSPLASGSLEVCAKSKSVSLWLGGVRGPCSLGTWTLGLTVGVAPHQLAGNRLRCGGLLWQDRCALWLWDRGWCENQDIAYGWLATAESSIKSVPSKMWFLRPWEGTLL